MTVIRINHFEAKQDSIEAHQKAATAIPPADLEKAKSLVARPPIGEYFQ